MYEHGCSKNCGPQNHSHQLQPCVWIPRRSWREKQQALMNIRTDLFSKCHNDPDRLKLSPLQTQCVVPKQVLVSKREAGIVRVQACWDRHRSLLMSASFVLCHRSKCFMEFKAVHATLVLPPTLLLSSLNRLVLSSQMHLCASCI